MNCQQVNKLIEQYDEGELPQEVASRVESHLDTCAECQVVLRLAAKERFALQSREDIPALAPDFAEAVMTRISVVPRTNLAPLVPIWVEWTRRYSTLLGTVAVILLFLFPLLHQPAFNVNDEMAPVQPETAQKVAAIDRAQNVMSTPVAGTPSEPAPLNEPQYRSSASIESPSRSIPASGLTGNNENVSYQSLSPAEASDASAPSVAPSYIPSGYILDKIKIQEGNQVLVSYLPIGDEAAAPLLITVVPDMPKEDVRTMQDDDAPGDTVVPPASIFKVMNGEPAADQTVGFTAEGTYNGHLYHITSNLPLPPEEMDSLSRSLQPR